MRQHQRRIGGKSAEYLSRLGIVEGVKTASERLAVKRQNTRAGGRFAAVQVCGVFAKDLLDIRWVKPLQNITDRRVRGRPLPTDLERLVQPSPVRLDEVQMPRYELAPVTIARMANSKTCGSL